MFVSSSQRRTTWWHLFVASLLLQLVHQSAQMVQIDLKQFKETYPEFASYLLNQTHQERSAAQPATVASKLKNALTASSSTGDGNKFLFYNKSSNTIEGVSMQSTYSIIRLTPSKNFTLITTTSTILPSATITTPYVASSTASSSSAARADEHPPLAVQTNSITHFEPMQQHAASQALLPLYHQFIYTIRITAPASEGDSSAENQSGEAGKELIDLLNEQTIESSQLRVKLLKTIGEKLGVNASSLRLNWIEKLDRSRIEPPTASVKASSLGTLNYYYILISLSNINLLDIQKSYSLKITMGTSSSRQKINELRIKYETECEGFFKYVQEKHVRRSASAVGKKKPVVAEEMSFNLVGLASEISSGKSAARLNEQIKKVQLLKLCDLKQIYSILTLSTASGAKDKAPYLASPHSLLPNQLAMANIYIKNSTQEITFKSKPPATRPLEKSKSAEEAVDDEAHDYESGPRRFGVKASEGAKIVKLKMKTSQLAEGGSVDANQTQQRSDDDNNSVKYVIDGDSDARLESNETVNKTSHIDVFLAKSREWLETAKTWMWTVIPQEDVVLAVILPLTVIVSVLIMCIVVSCLLHGCNKNYRKRLKAQKLISSSSNTAGSASSNSTGLDKSSSGLSRASTNAGANSKHHQHAHANSHTLTLTMGSSGGGGGNKSNTLFGQKAFLTKGVPVILYEEMSDKPIDDYDENHRSITGGGGGGGDGDSDNEYRGGGCKSSYYRSPLIMRNEKPPMPAPPEYTRPPSKPSYALNGSLMNDQRLLNELQSILNSDMTTTRLLGSQIE